MTARPVRLSLASALCAGSIAAAVPGLAAQDGEWTSVREEGRCDLRLATGDNEIFSISMRADGSYALDGQAFAAADGEGSVGGEIRVLGKRGNVLLNGPAAAMDRQREAAGNHPVALFLAAIEGGDSFTLVTEAGLKPIPLDGYASPAAAFAGCVRVLFLPAGPRPPVPLVFEGLPQLVATARRERLLGEVIGFTLEVDARGNPRDCTLGRDFSREAVTIDLCRALVDHHRFEPARDAEGNAVPGTYTSRIDFRMWMGEDGFAERGGQDTRD